MVRAETFATFLDTASPLLDQEHLKRFSYSGVAAASLVVTYKRNHVCMHARQECSLLYDHWDHRNALPSRSHSSLDRILSQEITTAACSRFHVGPREKPINANHSAYTHEQVSGASSTANKKNGMKRIRFGTHFEFRVRGCFSACTKGSFWYIQCGRGVILVQDMPEGSFWYILYMYVHCIVYCTTQIYSYSV